jgi:prolyl oligopeptidase
MPQFSPLALFVTALLASMVTPSMKAHSESLTPKAAAMTDAASDPLLWLEEVEGKTALDWVAAENKRSLDALQADPRYEALHTAALKIVNASDRVPMPSFRAGGIDNFWQDKDAVRGVWRRTSLDSYRTKTPQWETVLDIDALSKSEAANWVYKGSNCLAPEERLCLVSLSDGGKDAVEVREFDTAAKAFVKDGFALPAGKQQAAWIDKDTLLVGREWTPGLVTESGYPFVIKRLKRGQALSQATEVFAGAKGDVGVWPGVIRDADGRHVADYVTRAVGFFDSEVHILTPKGSVRLLVPTKSSFQAYLDGQAIFTLEEAWTAPNGKAFAQGALISFDLAKAIGDPKALARDHDHQCGWRGLVLCARAQGLERPGPEPAEKCQSWSGLGQ